LAATVYSAATDIKGNADVVLGEPVMEALLKDLLTQLKEIGEEREELYDSEVRERMRDAVFNGFLKPAHNFELPFDFGMGDEEGNEVVREAIAKYITDANNKAKELGLDFSGRYSAFQTNRVTVGPIEVTYGDFFGYVPLDDYDDRGNLL
jgi:hypothetical protein